MQFISTSNSLSPSLQSALFNVLSQVSPTKGPWEQGKQLLHHCEEAFDESKLLVLATCLWMKESSLFLLRQKKCFLQVKDQQDFTIRKHLVHPVLVHYTSKLLRNTGHGKKKHQVIH
jgi:hypothetical protein